MPRLPGLTPIVEDTNPTSAGRPITPISKPQLNSPQLRPAAAPVDTYARPAQAPQDNSWMDIAQSLVGFNPNLQHYIDAEVNDQKLNNDSLGRAQRTLMTHSADEVRQGIKDGSMPEFKDAKSMELWGQHLAQQRFNDLEKRYLTDFDREHGDFPAWVREQIAPDLADFKDDRLFTGSYYKTLQPMLDQLTGTQNQFLVDTQNTQLRDTQFNVWKNGARFGVAEGKSPDDVAASIFSDFQSNHDLLKMPYKDQQAMVLQMADQFATSGQIDIAEALLKHERESDGLKLSLVNDRDLGGKAADILQRITLQRQKTVWAQEGQQAEAQNDQQLIQAANNGTVFAVEDAEIADGKGGTKTLTREARVKRAEELILKQSQDTAKTRAETPEQTFERELNTFSISGLKHEEWSRTLEAGFQGASGTTINGDQLPPAIQAGYDLYSKLYTTNPRYLTKLIGQDAMEYYEAIRVGQQMGGLSLQQAHANALAATSDPAKFNGDYYRIQFNQMQDAVNNLGRTGGFSLLGLNTGVGATDIVNKGDVARDLTQMGELALKLGYSPDQSIKYAQDRYKATHINVNGWYLYSGDRNLPANAPDLFTQTIKSYIDHHPDEGLEFGDLSIRPVGNNGGTWEIFHKSFGGTVEDRHQGIITTQTLADMQKLMDREKMDRVIKSQGENADTTQLMQKWFNLSADERHQWQDEPYNFIKAQRPGFFDK